MQVYFSPIQRDFDKIEYEFIGEKIIITHQGIIEEFDFSNMPNGLAEQIISEKFEFCPIISAKREGGELLVELMWFYKGNVPNEVLFPSWVDSNSIPKNYNKDFTGEVIIDVTDNLEI